MTGDTVFHFGKHKLKPLQKIPSHYLEWVINNHTEDAVVRMAESELSRRAGRIIRRSSDSKLARKTASRNRAAVERARWEAQATVYDISMPRPAALPDKYRWRGPTGIVDDIPGDVDMWACVGEEAPF